MSSHELMSCTRTISLKIKWVLYTQTVRNLEVLEFRRVCYTLLLCCIINIFVACILFVFFVIFLTNIWTETFFFRQFFSVLARFGNGGSVILIFIRRLWTSTTLTNYLTLIKIFYFETFITYKYDNC